MRLVPALEVVHQRLVKAGLGDVCLELHSRQANKRSVIQEIDRTRRGSTSTAVSSRMLALRNSIASRVAQRRDFIIWSEAMS